MSIKRTTRLRLNRVENWIRRRLRALVWHHWKTRRNRVRQLEQRGITHDFAVRTGCTRKGAWRMARNKRVQIALPDRTFHDLGLVIRWP